MIRWRIPLLKIAFRATGYSIMPKYKMLKSFEYDDTQNLLDLQNEKLYLLIADYTPADGNHYPVNYETAVHYQCAAEIYNSFD